MTGDGSRDMLAYMDFGFVWADCVMDEGLE